MRVLRFPIPCVVMAAEIWEGGDDRRGEGQVGVVEVQDDFYSAGRSTVDCRLSAQRVSAQASAWATHSPPTRHDGM